MKIARVLMCMCALMIFDNASSSAMGWLPSNDGGKGASHSAPGPMIGVGVPAVVAFGCYLWFRLRQRNR
jgi:hypothetical protein